MGCGKNQDWNTSVVTAASKEFGRAHDQPAHPRRGDQDGPYNPPSGNVFRQIALKLFLAGGSFVSWPI